MHCKCTNDITLQWSIMVAVPRAPGSRDTIEKWVKGLGKALRYSTTTCRPCVCDLHVHFVHLARMEVVSHGHTCTMIESDVNFRPYSNND